MTADERNWQPHCRPGSHWTPPVPVRNARFAPLHSVTCMDRLDDGGHPDLDRRTHVFGQPAD